METSNYERWWQLHLRVAQGDTLSASEQVVYQAGLDQLDQEEAQGEPEDVVALRTLRAQIESQTAVHAQRVGRSAQLDQQIAALERTYQQLTGYELAVDTHASS